VVLQDYGLASRQDRLFVLFLELQKIPDTYDSN
jgi:hypothetical protein